MTTATEESFAHVFALRHWHRDVGASDRALLGHCVGATLDIGCGPGRMSEHLVRRGHTVLAIDVVAEAVAQTRERGVAALLRDVFSPLPGEGRWETALLADGNVGIGGDPERLLHRVAALLGPRGRVVVDLGRPGVGVRPGWVALRVEDGAYRQVRWSLVGADVIGRIAEAAGLSVRSTHAHGDRWFAVLAKER